ncbi:cuticle protein 19.8-like [Palaemon carinicauda]|uniref:cuticle protein 19.8-like n=1 Tax=Palaemon carinicauda TaxID=392227 RepID=UPI0035B63800
MSKAWVVLVSVAVICLGIVTGGPAKLEKLTTAASTQGYNYNAPVTGYNYDPPKQPSGLYEIPDKPSGLYVTPLPTISTTLPPTTTRTPPPPPPPPSGLYNLPSNPVPVTANPPTTYPPRPQPPSTTARTTTTTTAMMGGMPYDFGYGVDDPDSGNQFSQKEASDGNVVRGEYRVLLPDGRLQIVRYFDEGNGFNVDISYE